VKRARFLAALLLLAGTTSLTAGYYIPTKAVVAQVLLHLAWQRTRSRDDHTRPWPWARTWPVARLRAPKAGFDAIVLAGAEGAALAFGPGHVDGTALPGAAGNTVIAGHRDTAFRFLESVRLGDELVVDGPERDSHRFIVVDTLILDENDVSVLEPTSETTITLVTCYPFDAVWPGGRLRYVVRAVERAPGGLDR
jgi:sortase A